MNLKNNSIITSCPLCSSKNIKTQKLQKQKIEKCISCNLQFIKTRSQNTSYFKNYNKFRNHTSSHFKLRLKQYEIDSNFLSNIISKGNILDVGCSDGIFLNKLNQVGIYNLFGIDPDEMAIKNAKKKFPKIKFESSNLLEFESKIKFDAIIFRGSFQFLGLELQDTLKKLHHISKRKTKFFFFSLPNSDSFLYYLFKEKWNLFDEKSHKLIFNKFSIERLCKLYNFEIEHISYPYIDTPYANPLKDYKKIMRSIRLGNFVNVPFWGNMMQLVLKIK